MPRVKIPRKEKNDITLSFIKDIYNDCDKISYKKVLLIFYEIIKQIKKLILEGNIIKIKGFATFSSKVFYPRMTNDKRNGKVYLSKGRRKVLISADKDFVERINELTKVSKDGSKKD